MPTHLRITDTSRLTQLFWTDPVHFFYLLTSHRATVDHAENVIYVNKKLLARAVKFLLQSFYIAGKSSISLGK